MKSSIKVPTGEELIAICQEVTAKHHAVKEHYKSKTSLPAKFKLGKFATANQLHTKSAGTTSAQELADIGRAVVLGLESNRVRTAFWKEDDRLLKAQGDAEKALIEIEDALHDKTVTVTALDHKDPFKIVLSGRKASVRESVVEASGKFSEIEIEGSPPEFTLIFGEKGLFRYQRYEALILNPDTLDPLISMTVED